MRIGVLAVQGAFAVHISAVKNSVRRHLRSEMQATF